MLSIYDESVPTKTSMREMLMLAGLGEKKVQIPDADCTTEEFHEALTKSFPKLKIVEDLNCNVAYHPLMILNYFNLQFVFPQVFFKI